MGRQGVMRSGHYAQVRSSVLASRPMASAAFLPMEAQQPDAEKAFDRRADAEDTRFAPFGLPSRHIET
ncbi:MAG: hypothetical protein A3G26_09240 [Betaproteobacteria bacterium RIFCSPLOWO2_12_FULL_65_110]|nr:MAG: hypothetical protein A3G26_09240 [Betaproteobacteria bacterium RIFCSPLOWO2_12_FULL_65_110]